MTATAKYQFVVASWRRRAEVKKIAEGILGPGWRVTVTRVNFGYNPLLKITERHRHSLLDKEPFVRDMRDQEVLLADDSSHSEV